MEEERRGEEEGRREVRLLELEIEKEEEEREGRRRREGGEEEEEEEEKEKEKKKKGDITTPSSSSSSSSSSMSPAALKALENLHLHELSVLHSTMVAKHSRDTALLPRSSRR